MFRQHGLKKRKMLDWKNIKLSILFIAFFCSSCNDAAKSKMKFETKTDHNALRGKQFLSGQVGDLNYSIITGDQSLHVSKHDIENLLTQIQLGVSAQNKHSFIYHFNHSEKKFFSFKDSLKFLTNCFKLADSINRQTNGYLDPTAYFLTKEWGFDAKTINDVDTNSIQKYMNQVGFSNKHLLFYTIDDQQTIQIIKRNSRLKLNFTVLYRGLAADFICAMLSKHNNNNYLIEIDGVRKVKGRNIDGLQWQIGIDIPKKPEFGYKSIRDYTKIVNLSHGAIASAGNYNSYYIDDENKRSYTINPKTGFPVTHHLLSATVWAKTCADADAYAHAFMAMGLNKTIHFINKNSAIDVEVLLFYSDEKGNLKNYKSEGMKQMLKD